MSKANQIIRRPLVTEKSTMMREDGGNTIAFEVDTKANKIQVKAAVEELFDVKVARVNVIKVQAKPKRRGAFKGTRQGWKKAVVQLRAGDTIEIFEGAQL